MLDADGKTKCADPNFPSENMPYRKRAKRQPPNPIPILPVDVIFQTLLFHFFIDVHNSPPFTNAAAGDIDSLTPSAAS